MSATTTWSTVATKWVLPARNDLRWPFAASLTLYAVLGFTFFGFNRTPLQMAMIISAGCALDVLLGAAAGKPFRFPLSAYITCVSLALLLNFAHTSWVLLLPVLLSVGSKYCFTFNGRHVFNPSLFGVTTSLLFANDVITTAPAYQWAGGDITLSFGMVMLAGFTFFRRLGRLWLVVSFLGFYAVQTAVRAHLMRHHIPAEMLLVGTVTAPAFFLFTFYMLTDPATSPNAVRGQVVLALAITLVDLYLHLFESVFTFLYAALTVASAKFLFLHGRRLWQQRGLALPRLGLRDALVRATVLLVAVTATFATRASTGTTIAASNVTFQLHEHAATEVGLHTPMGNTLAEVDPRVAHVAKWLLSVGSSAAVEDVNADGLLDVFLTQPLAAAPHRVGLYLNRDGVRFERAPVPALDAFNAADHVSGLATGSTLLDFDGDGDIDVTVAVSFGRSRILQNQLAQNGELAFTDITSQSGIGPHHTSIHAGFFDFDRDAHLDLFIANVLPTHFESYPTRPPLSLFALPAPEYDGDRRALRFMHDGWHDANNGGVNELYRGRGDGTFERFSNIPEETRWSLAVCYTDVNRDGFTDLYVANDFGPDRLYLNRQGQRFESIIGSSFGDIGKDTYKGMNCSVGDVDNDAQLDLYVSNVHHPLQAEGSLLWINHSTPEQVDLRNEATQRGALNDHRFGWGAALFDLNNDGWLDIVQANGMVDDRLDDKGYARKDYWYVNHKLMQSGPEIHTYADMWGDIRGRIVFPNEQRRAYLNLGTAAPGYFGEAASLIGLTQGDNSRAVVPADFDNDGDLDVLITNQHGSVSSFTNSLRSAGALGPEFVGVRLIGNGVTTHRTALGSRVRVEVAAGGALPQAQWREMSASSGLSAQGDPRLHFGLGNYTGPVEVQVDWYGGASERYTVTSGQYHTLRQQQALPGPQ